MNPQIIVTNDDGIESPGIWAIADSLSNLGDVWVTAPEKQATGAGRCFFRESTGVIREIQPRIEKKNIRAFAIDASPAQCVFQAVGSILPEKAALVVSGINYGENIGNIVTSSGTVGACIEAGSLGILSMALSQEIDPHEDYLKYSEKINFSAAAWFGAKFAEKIIAEGLPAGADILKVDVPAEGTIETPWRVTRVSRLNEMRRQYVQKKFSDPAHIIYGPIPDPQRAEPDSDIWAICVDKVVSVTPMTFDLTAAVNFLDLQKQLK